MFDWSSIELTFIQSKNPYDATRKAPAAEAMTTPGSGWPRKINNGPVANTQILREGGWNDSLPEGTARVELLI